ncbi:MAG: hypothetical protein ACLR0U_08350 [Enterocloster clostridioformis]
MMSRKAELAVNMLMRLIDGEEVRESEPKIDAVIAERESVMKVEGDGMQRIEINENGIHVY